MEAEVHGILTDALREEGLSDGLVTTPLDRFGALGGLEPGLLFFRKSDRRTNFPSSRSDGHRPPQAGPRGSLVPGSAPPLLLHPLGWRRWLGSSTLTKALQAWAGRRVVAEAFFGGVPVLADETASRSYVDDGAAATMAFRPVAKELTRARQGNDVRVGLGLCLSGGGYRAALFHLGALRRLNEFGILAHVDIVSAVSGGSILAGFLATRWSTLKRSGDVFDDWDRAVEEPFRQITATDVRTRATLLRVIGRPAVRSIARRLAHSDRIGPASLRQLPEHPLFVFGATDLVHRRYWTFSRHGAGSRKTGLYGMDGTWTVARAAATSACFPPLFAPMKCDGLIPVSGYPTDILPELRITDGGVLDNNGYMAVWNKCQDVLVSDGGGSLGVSQKRLSWWRTLGRYQPMVEFASKSSQKALLLTNLTSGLHGGAFWGIRTKTTKYPSRPAGYSSVVVNEAISVIRTDLDRFSDTEAQILINHGYLLTDAAVRDHARHLIKQDSPARAPYPDWFPRADEDISAALAGSSRRRLYRRK